MDTPASPEARFIDYARHREPSVLEALLREHADQAYTQARRLLGRPDLAEDAVQDACVRLIDSAGRYHPGIPFAAWFGRLVYLASVDQRRKRARHQRGLSKAASMTPPRSEEREVDETQLEPQRAALAALPENYRTPLSLYYFGGLDRDGIARALGLRPGTVGVRLTRGIERLRTTMARVGFAGTSAVLVDLLGGLPSYAAEPALHAAMSSAAAGGKAGIAAGGWSSLLKAAWMKVTLACIGTTAMVSTAGVIHDLRTADRISTTSNGSALVQAMPANSWLAVPGTKMRPVFADPVRYPKIQAVCGARSVITAWSGAALDARRGRLLVWGGGYSDYWGNEIYAFDLGRMAWTLVTEPFAEPVLDASETNADGTPKGRSTYGGLAYLARSDRFFAAGGCIGGSTSVRARKTWIFDIASQRWTDHGVQGAGHSYGACCAYDPATGLVWFACDSTWGPGGLWTYDEGTDTWTKRHPADNYEVSCALDAKRGRLVIVGRGHVYAYDLRADPVTRSEWTTTGGDQFVAKEKPGLDYDPARDRIVGWHGGSVYALDPDTRAWTAYDAPGAPETTASGIYGRWRYVPDLDAFVVVTSADEEVHIYKPAR
jgi:RNA polymerase sigma factor (sigma-70 family)